MLSERTCVGCRQRFAQEQLLRFFREPHSGAIRLTAEGTRAGRGAYVCASRACLKRACERGGLSRALRVEGRPEVREMLAAAVQELEQSIERLLRQCERDGRGRRIENEEVGRAERREQTEQLEEVGSEQRFEERCFRWGDQTWRLTQRGVVRRIERLGRLHGQLLG